MRIALCTEEKNKDATISPHFGRCNYYCIYDSNDLSISFIDNPHIKENAAGQKSAELLLGKHVDYIILDEIGSKAYKKLEGLKMKCYQANKESLIDNIYSFIEKKLEILKHGTKENKHNHTHNEEHDHKH